ncbi:hypothetical protein Tco_0946303, partial [Tanacetum coccineum]
MVDTYEVIPFKEYKFKFSVINGKKPLNFDYKTFFKSTGLDYAKGTYVSHPYPEVVKAELAKIAALCLLSPYRDKELLGLDYTQDESFGSSPTILSKSSFLKDPSTVTPIELTDVMVAVNKREHSVNPLSFSVKKKKGKSRNVAPTLPQSQGPKAPGLLLQKRNKRLPSTLDEGTHKSQPLPEGTTTDPKDSGENVQPADKGLPSMDFNEGMAKTMPRLEGPLRDKDSGGNKPPADMEPINPIVANPSGTGAEYQAQHEEADVSYAALGASVEGYYEENIAHRDQTDKLVEASMSSLEKSHIVISDLYTCLNIITELLKDIKNAIKDDYALNKKVIEATEAYTKNSSAITKLLNL